MATVVRTDAGTWNALIRKTGWPLQPDSRGRTACSGAIRQAMEHLARPKDTDLIFYGERGRDKKHRPYVFNPVC